MSRIVEFLIELRARRVYRVAAMYGVVAWVVIEAASIIVPELLLPPLLTRAIIVLALLGFPLALVLAWAYDIGTDGVQRAGAARTVDIGAGAAPDSVPAATQPHASRPSRRLPASALAGALVVLAVAAGLGVYAFGGIGRTEVLRGPALLTELGRLADAGRYVDAFKLAQLAAEAGQEVPDSVSHRFTNRLTVLTEPAGARVRAWRFVPGAPAQDTVWADLGRTPLRGLAVPRDDYHLRVEADGYAPVERMASSAGARALDRPGTAEVHLEVQLMPLARVPEGMVHVPGGLYRVASRDLQSLSAQLDDFFIDRFEVTNAHYMEFVDADGYGRTEYWLDLADAARAAAHEVRQRFVDRTGLPAPRQWTGQRPPPGAEAHPVTDVSWYEAAAYCRFRGGALPTLFEWEKAARDGVTSIRGIELPWGYVGPRDPGTDRANLSGTGTTPVGSYPFGVSAYGAWDMAGNAKEWLRNRSESGRAVTGGSWADPIYVFSEVGSMDPATASPVVGFRCARGRDDAASQPGAQGNVPLRLAIETPEYVPADDATFRGLLSHYQYDPRPLEAVVEERREDAGWVRERITYAVGDGQRAIAYLFLPKAGRPPYQTMVYVPSVMAFFGSSVPAQAESTLGPLVRAGRAMFTVVMEGMTERAYPADYVPPATNSAAFRDQMVRRAIELRLGLDYLETRDNIDVSRLAYVGNSWGAGSRLLFAAIDDRFRATVLIGAGIDERLQPTLPEASNINFAPRIRGPKLVVNGREDEEHPWRTRALPLWNLLTEPKQLELFDGVGHLPPPELRIPAIREFLDRHLN